MGESRVLATRYPSHVVRASSRLVADRARGLPESPGSIYIICVTSAHRWYPRPVLFVADVHRAIRFYVEALGFEKSWHEADGAGTVCQVNHGECEIILCADAARRDRGRLYIELTPEGLADLRRVLAERSVAAKESWWGNDVLQVDDPDGNELFFPHPD